MAHPASISATLTTQYAQNVQAGRPIAPRVLVAAVTGIAVAVLLADAVLMADAALTPEQRITVFMQTGVSP